MLIINRKRDSEKEIQKNIKKKDIKKKDIKKKILRKRY